MTRLHRFWARHTRCRITTHDVDWIYHAMTNVRRCIHCEHAMPEPPGSCHVGDLNPSIGD